MSTNVPSSAEIIRAIKLLEKSREAVFAVDAEMEAITARMERAEANRRWADDHLKGLLAQAGLGAFAHRGNLYLDAAVAGVDGWEVDPRGGTMIVPVASIGRRRKPA